MAGMCQPGDNNAGERHNEEHSPHRVPMTSVMKPLFVMITALALTACGQNSASVNDSDGDSTRPVAAVQGQDLDFGMTAAVEGAEVTVSEAQPLAPGANSWWADQEGQAVEVTITLKNTGTKPFEPYLFSVEAQAGGNDCELIYDSEIGLDGVPLDAVSKGQSAVWRSGYLCPAATGDPLVVLVSEDTSSDALVRFTGSMP
jgi:hypothetical protein